MSKKPPTATTATQTLSYAAVAARATATSQTQSTQLAQRALASTAAVATVATVVATQASSPAVHTVKADKTTLSSGSPASSSSSFVPSSSSASPSSLKSSTNAAKAAGDRGGGGGGGANKNAEKQNKQESNNNEITAVTSTATVPECKIAAKGKSVPVKQQEVGISYSLVLDDDRKQLIGIKRFAGYFCYKCNASLLVDGEEMARDAIKHHHKQCPICACENGATADIVPCAAFDWIMAPHLLPRKSPPLADDHAADERGRRRRTLAKPSNAVCDQFGNTFELEHFWKRVVDPCPIQFYDRIRQ